MFSKEYVIFKRSHVRVFTIIIDFNDVRPGTQLQKYADHRYRIPAEFISLKHLKTILQNITGCIRDLYCICKYKLLLNIEFN